MLVLFVSYRGRYYKCSPGSIPGFFLNSLPNLFDKLIFSCKIKSECGNSSGGRAPRCQRGGRGFKSRFPLFRKGGIAKWLRQRSAKPLFAGSNPAAAFLGADLVRLAPIFVFIDFSIMVFLNLLRQIEELERRYKESRQKLRILFEITQLLSSYLHLKEVLQGIVKLLKKEYRFDFCAIFLLNSNGSLKVKNCVGLEDRFSDKVKEVPLLDSYSKRCFETKKIVIENDIDEVSEEDRINLLIPYDMKSFALTPIIADDKVIGILITASKRKNYFHIRYSDAIYIIASEIGIAIKMAQLYEEIYNAQKELEKKVKERTAQLEETHKRLLEIERHAAMGKMANRVAHELRNSLTVIGGFARRLSKRLSKDDPNKEYVDIIMEEVEKLEKKVAKIIRLEPEED